MAAEGEGGEGEGGEGQTHDEALDVALHELGRRFTAAAIPRGEWTHAAHLSVGAWHVAHIGPDAAVAILRGGIRLLNEAHGTPNSETSGYHETITRAYVVLVSQFLDACPPAQPLGARVDALLRSPLAARDVLLRFWRRETLMSPAARARWVPPDLAELNLEGLDSPSSR